MNTLREVIRWTWLIVCIVDAGASALAWVEMKGARDRALSIYIARIMFSDALRVIVSAIGLVMFGINVQSHLWFILLGLFSVMLQGGATIGWLLYIRGHINGGGMLGLIKSLTQRKKRTS